VAIPLLAALVIVNRQEAFRRRMTTSVLVTIAQVTAQTCAFVGVVAGFWHILWIAGVGLLASGIVAVGCFRQGAGAWNGTRRFHPRMPRNPVTPTDSLGAILNGVTTPRRRVPDRANELTERQQIRPGTVATGRRVS
jgi:hypothetical protein